MGNQSTKTCTGSSLSAEESIFVENSFKGLTGNNDKLKSDTLIKAWTELVDHELVTHFKDCCFGHEDDEHRTIELTPYLEHYYVAVWGSLCEKSNFINTRVFGNPPGVEGGITSHELFKFVASVVRGYFAVLDHNKTEQYNSWLKENVAVNRKDIDNYVQFLLKDLMNTQPISLNDLENWLHMNPLWLDLWKAVVVFLYSRSQHKKIPSSVSDQPKVLPFAETPSSADGARSILDVGKIMFISEQLPTEYRLKWRLLFNSKIHGESFATFLGKMINRGPTILIVEDEDGYMFGGFAPDSWNLGPKFIGNDTAALFTLQPEMQSFATSGYNDHYQYLNTNQQTMPNGLGMGGQFEYWGLWLDCEYGLGKCSETCTTFKNYQQMSKKKEFKVRNIEVWAVGEEPKNDDDERPQGSILDTNLEEKVILELAGTHMHSEGLRDPDLDL